MDEIEKNLERAIRQAELLGAHRFTVEVSEARDIVNCLRLLGEAAELLSQRAQSYDVGDEISIAKNPYRKDWRVYTNGSAGTNDTVNHYPTALDALRAVRAAQPRAKGEEVQILSNTDERKIKPGDEVHHRPSGEHWIVSAVSPNGRDVIPAGWPESIAEARDCELLKSCSDAESQQMIDHCAELGSLRGSWSKASAAHAPPQAGGEKLEMDETIVKRILAGETQMCLEEMHEICRDWLTLRAIVYPDENCSASATGKLDYPAAARAIALHLMEWLDESLPYPQMIRLAAVRANEEIKSLRRQLADAQEELARAQRREEQQSP